MTIIYAGGPRSRLCAFIRCILVLTGIGVFSATQASHAGNRGSTLDEYSSDLTDEDSMGSPDSYDPQASRQETLALELEGLANNDPNVTSLSYNAAAALDKDTFVNFTKILAKNSTLTELNLPYRGEAIGDLGAIALADALASNVALRRMFLYHCNIGEEGVKALANSLSTNSSLDSLNLSGNSIDDEGIKALADTLTQNASITSLDLSGNPFGNHGLAFLAESLKNSSSLKRLSLGSIPMDTQAVEDLTRCLRENSTLESLDISNTTMGNDGARALSELLAANTPLNSLTLAGNRIGDAGAEALFDAITQNTNLTALDLNDNDIHDWGAEVLAKILGNSPRLRHALREVYLLGNPIGENGKTALEPYFHGNLFLSQAYDDQSLQIVNSWR